VAESVVAVVREGLTNARRHAGTAPVQVRVGADAGWVQIDVVNDHGEPSLGPGSRRGLAGLRARLAAAQGELQAGPTPDGGWHLRCRLPR
jgi:signal transduction histidine kinase